jgi:hypothetical protein
LQPWKPFMQLTATSEPHGAVGYLGLKKWIKTILNHWDIPRNATYQIFRYGRTNIKYKTTNPNTNRKCGKKDTHQNQNLWRL